MPIPTHPKISAQSPYSLQAFKRRTCHRRPFMLDRTEHAFSSARRCQAKTYSPREWCRWRFSARLVQVGFNDDEWTANIGCRLLHHPFSLFAVAMLPHSTFSALSFSEPSHDCLCGQGPLGVENADVKAVGASYIFYGVFSGPTSAFDFIRKCCLTLWKD